MKAINSVVEVELDDVGRIPCIPIRDGGIDIIYVRVRWEFNETSEQAVARATRIANALTIHNGGKVGRD